MFGKIVYICKDCKWSVSVIELWRGLKPKKCGNKKCGTNFIKNPDKLMIIEPKKDKEVVNNEPKKKHKFSRKSSK